MKNPYCDKLRCHFLALAAAFVAFVFPTSLHAADMNVLIIGSTADGGDRFGGKSDAFVPTQIATELRSILAGAGLGTVNVVVEDRYKTASDDFGSSYSYNLASWYHWPYPAGVETTTRWPNLRGELGTVWDYVVLIGDPYTMENMPGQYAHGVEMIAQEVAKGSAEVILLMPWPAAANNTSSVAHYKEVVYRAGRTGGYKVAPAALAWQADGSNTGTTHPSTRGAYICASSIYSSIWGQSAAASTYTYNDTLADLVNTTVSNNLNAVQFSGNKMNFQSPFLMFGDKRRDVHFSEKGSSTEQYYKNGAGRAMDRAKVTYNHSSYCDKYDSETPVDDNLGWPVDAPLPIAWNHGRDNSDVKSYVVNPAVWQLAWTFHFQDNSEPWPDDEANDICLARIFSHELGLANSLKSGGSSQRLAAWRLMWGQIHKQYPSEQPTRDTAFHVNTCLEDAVGAFMYTIYSGRCPLNVGEESTLQGYARKVGYETAWRLGTCSTRAPGFKVLPSASAKKSITPGTTETMTVQFILPPKADVTVNVSLSNSSAAIVGPQKLVFTPTNYNIPQQVVVTGLDGPLATQSFNVVYSTTSTDVVYDGLSDSWEYSIDRVATQSVTYATVATNAVSKYKNFELTIPINVTGANSSNTVLAGPAHGTLTWSGSSVIYNSTIDYFGLDGFAYAVKQNGVITTGYTQITVIDGYPDGTVTILPTDASASETGPDTGTWTFTRVGSTAAALQVYYTISGTATSGSDFTALAASVTFPIGASTVTRTLTPINDAEFEVNEAVTLTLTPNAAYILTSSSSATITIADNDKPTVTVAATDTICAEAGTADVGVFTLTRTGTTAATLKAYYTIGGTAVNGTDCTLLSGTVTFAVNASTATVTVTPTNDTSYEGPENVIITLSTDAAYLLGNQISDTLTIADNDKPTVSIVSNITSTQEGGSYPILTFSRTGNTGVGSLTIYYALSGTAAMGSDYNYMSGAVIIPQGQASTSIAAGILQDDVSEVPETLTVTISTNTAYTAASSPANAASITILDDNESLSVTISATDNIASEPARSDGTGTFTITRSRITATPLTVNLSVGGTATGGSDYAALPVTVTIPSGQLSATVTVTSLDDSEAETDETVVLNLQAGSGYLVGTTTAATINLYDDEAAQVRVEVSDAKCIEGTTADAGNFLLRRLGNRTAALTVNYTRTGTATSGTDFTALSGTATIGANSVSANVAVTPIDDSLTEGTETVILTLATGTGYTIHTQNTGTIEIRDDETVDVNLSVTDSACAEQATPDTGTFRITRSATAVTSLTVSYAITGTTSGSDYATLTGTATIAANATTVDIVVTPTNDGILEGSESIIMTLTGAGATYDIGDARSSTLWIKDDETPNITLAATDSAAAEADGSTTNEGLWTFTASFPPASNLTINYTVSTNNGIDCVELPGSIILPAGQTSVTLPLIPIDDELAEAAENVSVTLAYNGNYNLTTTSAVNVTIAANDIPQASIVAFDPNAAESPLKTGRFIINLNRVFAATTAVKYTISGTATSGSDYTALTGSINVSAGASSTIVTVTPVDDVDSEGSESVTLTLIAATGYVVGSPNVGTVSIADNEAALSALANWKESAFGENSSDPTIAGDAIDYDQDGLPNLLEYAFGSDPTTTTEGSEGPQSSTSAGALRLSFNRVVSNNDITIIIQAADDLNNTWTDIASSINGAPTTALTAGVVVTETGTGSTRSVSVTDSYATNDPAHPRRFMRIKVSN